MTTTPTRLERFYAWLDGPTRYEQRIAERATVRQVERYLKGPRNPRTVARGRAACDAVTFACVAGMLVVLAVSGPDRVERDPAPTPSVVVDDSARQSV